MVSVTWRPMYSLANSRNDQSENLNYKPVWVLPRMSLFISVPKLSTLFPSLTSHCLATVSVVRSTIFVLLSKWPLHSSLTLWYITHVTHLASCHHEGISINYVITTMWAQHNKIFLKWQQSHNFHLLFYYNCFILMLATIFKLFQCLTYKLNFVIDVYKVKRVVILMVLEHTSPQIMGNNYTLQGS